MGLPRTPAAIAGTIVIAAFVIGLIAIWISSAVSKRRNRSRLGWYIVIPANTGGARKIGPFKTEDQAQRYPGSTWAYWRGDQWLVGNRTWYIDHLTGDEQPPL